MVGRDPSPQKKKLGLRPVRVVSGPEGEPRSGFVRGVHRMKGLDVRVLKAFLMRPERGEQVILLKK